MHRLTESIIDHAAITLIIAHPDDECMFFYPTISRAKRLHIICLSNGGYDGLGEEREKELQRAARRLGASATCVNNAALQDGPHAWNPSVVAANVGPWLHAGAVVVTFDRYGASGHANHVAVYHGAAPASVAPGHWGGVATAPRRRLRRKRFAMSDWMSIVNVEPHEPTRWSARESRPMSAAAVASASTPCSICI